MGCFGQCNCGCCLSESEIEEIALSVDIGFIEEVATTRNFVNSGCCWTASKLTNYDDYDVSDPYLVQTSIVDESAQVSVKITESKKISASGTVFQTDEGFCILTVTEVAPPSDICSEEINCGTVLKTSEDIEKVYAAIMFRAEEIKVSVHKELMICEPNGPTECRYIVECAVRFSVMQGGYLYSSHTYTTDFSNEFTCCERLDCGTEKPTHDIDYGSDPSDAPPWVYGNPADYWLVRYKTYDAIDDIPEEITFTAEDINTCTTARCLEGDQYLVLVFEAEPFDIEGNSIAEIPFTHFCEYCQDLGMVCFPSLDDQACTRPPNPPFPCDCEENADTRFEANNLSLKGTGGSLNTSFNAIVGTFNGRCDGSPCHSLKQPDFFTSINDCIGTFENPGECYTAAEETGQNAFPGVDVADRNICNWWDCQDCYFTGYDPVIPPHQEKFSTVDSYSFNHAFTPGTGDGIEIPFPSVYVKFNR